MAAKLPWMKFWGRDFFNDQAVKEMDNALVGAYLRLLWDAWEHDGLPTDPHRVARLAGVQPLEVAPLLDLFPIAPDGRRRNARQERERAEMLTQYEARRRGGLVSKGNLKHQNNGPSSAEVSAEPIGEPMEQRSAESRLRVSSSSPALGNGSLEGISPEKEGGAGGRLETELRDGLTAEGVELLDLLLKRASPAKRFAFVAGVRRLGPGGADQCGLWEDVSNGLREAAKKNDIGLPSDNLLAACVRNSAQKRTSGRAIADVTSPTKPAWLTPLPEL